ncbi:hypothetical protein ZIOFF_011613 [Zingiber officinale]|uniref:Uncharacterized protein n=1 Tax=Zingiber officinale TaxID=94328 RepID=A0A8J5LQ71_ZINOF|nr:hypothetical protein ZIOFF_011613 [Zingiber officinale]
MDKNRPSGEQNLVAWAKMYLGDRRRLYQIIDPRLEFNYSIKGVQKVAKIAYCCLSRDSKVRPSMEEIVKNLIPLQDLKDMASLYFHSRTSRASSNPPSELELHKLRKTHLKLISLRFHDGGLAKNLGVKGIARGGGGRWQQEVLDPEDLDALGALESRRRNRCHRGKGGKSVQNRSAEQRPGLQSSLDRAVRSGKIPTGQADRGLQVAVFLKQIRPHLRLCFEAYLGGLFPRIQRVSVAEALEGTVEEAKAVAEENEAAIALAPGPAAVMDWDTVRALEEETLEGMGKVATVEAVAVGEKWELVAAVEVVAAEEREAVMGQEDPDPGKGMDPAMALA